LIFRAAGVLFSVEPEEALSEADRAAIARLDSAGEGPPQAPVRIQIVPEPPWTSEDAGLYPQMEPPVQRWQEGRLLSSHRSFTAEIDPAAAWARLHRRVEHKFPLEVVIRTAMLARLPLLGGLPLHAAGVVLGSRAVAFFGPFSDELVAIAPGQPPWLVRSGFWGEGQERRGPSGAPLAALVALDRGPAYALDRLGPVDAVRNLVDSVPVPLAPPLWSSALAVAADTVSRVPVYRMRWTPSEPPWDRVSEAVPGLRV
jgi:hypothetical protein